MWFLDWGMWCSHQNRCLSSLIASNPAQSTTLLSSRVFSTPVPSYPSGPPRRQGGSPRWSACVDLFSFTYSSRGASSIWWLPLPSPHPFPRPTQGFLGSSNGKDWASNAEELGSMPGSGRSPGEGNGCPLQYFCQDNPKDRGAWQATVHGVTNLDMTEQLSYYHSVIWRSLSQLWLYRRPSTSFWLVLCKNCSTCRLFLTCFGGSWAPCPPTLPPGSFFILKF